MTLANIFCLPLHSPRCAHQASIRRRMKRATAGMSCHGMASASRMLYVPLAASHYRAARHERSEARLSSARPTRLAADR